MNVKRQSFGNKILSSFVTAIIGVILFFGSFVVLYINEGRENIGKIAESAVEITAEGHSLEKGELVGVRGSIAADAYAADDYLRAGDYVYIIRKVEMYAYEEEEHREEKDNFGGSTTITTTYTYSKKWTSSPKAASSFRGDDNEKPKDIPAGYDQKISGMPEQKEKSGEGLSIGGYKILSGLSFSGEKTLALSEEVISAPAHADYAVSESYLYIGEDGVSAAAPRLGDYRISYRVITAGDEGVLLGAVEDAESITGYTTPKNNTLFRFFAGAGSLEEASEILLAEHKTTTWILRLIGFLMMFIGLVAMTDPITKFLSVIPFFPKFPDLYSA